MKRSSIQAIPRMLVGALMVAVAAGRSPATDKAPDANFEMLPSQHLPNACRLTDEVISGGQPEGEAAFAELRALGVKTIITVDGARPDVAAAKKYGLRYVHLPHGYDGIPQQRMLELAKAVRDLPGVIYIHCHHGKHRSPAAAAAACVGVGSLNSAQALDVLKTAGTSPNYRGLFASVQAARPIAADELDNLRVEFHETEKIPPLADAMVAVEHHHDHLKSIAAADWKMPPDHPDLYPPHEALLLAQQFTELLRTDAVQAQPAQFAKLLRDGEKAAYELESSLRTEPRDTESNNGTFEKISANCQACHRQFRDVPLGEKQDAPAGTH